MILMAMNLIFKNMFMKMHLLSGFQLWAILFIQFIYVLHLIQIGVYFKFGNRGNERKVRRFEKSY